MFRFKRRLMKRQKKCEEEIDSLKSSLDVLLKSYNFLENQLNSLDDIEFNKSGEKSIQEGMLKERMSFVKKKIESYKKEIDSLVKNMR